METGTSGLSKQAELLYAELVRNGVSAQEAAPSEELGELLDLGLVSRHAQGGLVLNDPGSVGLQWSRRLATEVGGLLREAAAVQERLAGIAEAFDGAQRDSSGPVAYLRGLETINRAIEAAVRQVEFELLCAQPHGGRTQGGLDTAYLRDKPALDRGVSIRTIYPTNQRQQPLMRDHIRRSTRAGELVRTVPWPFTRAIIVDRKLAFMPTIGLSEVFQEVPQWSERNTATAATLVRDAAPLLTALQRLAQESRQAARERGEVLHLHGTQSVERAVTEAIQGVGHEILACLPQRPPDTAAHQVATGVRAALERGLPVRMIYSNLARQQEHRRRHVEALTRSGAQVRTVPWLFTQALIVDRRIALLPATVASQVPDKSASADAGGRHLLIANPNVVAHFVDHFEMLWAMGQHWNGATATGDPTPISLDDEELAILRFLDQGLTMDAIANRMGVSERTLSNRLAQLKGKFNVASLYALGSRWQALQDSQSIPGPRATGAAQSE